MSTTATNPLDVHGSELVAFGADPVPGRELTTGDVIRHYVRGSTLVACRVELDELPTAPGGRRARLVYGSGAVRSTVLDDAYPYERVRVPGAPVGRCYCPDDCGCRHPWRTNACGCTRHDHGWYSGTLGAGQGGAVRVELVAYAAAFALGLVPVGLAVAFVASLVGAVVGTLG